MVESNPPEAAQPVPEFDAQVQQILDRATILPPVRVAKSLQDPHPLIATELLQDSDGYRLGPNEAFLRISVSGALKARACRILDAFFKRVEQIGGTVRIEEIKTQWEHRYETVVDFAGAQIRNVRLREKQKRVLRPAVDRWRAGQTELKPTGLLMFEGDGDAYLEVLYRETPKFHRLEDDLNALIIDLIKTAGRRQVEKRKIEEVKNREAEEARLRRAQEEQLNRKRADLKRRQDAEQARVEALVEHADAWKRSVTIREFLDAYRKKLVERRGAVPTEGPIAEYLVWAEAQAARFSPLEPLPPSILDEKI